MVTRFRLSVGSSAVVALCAAGFALSLVSAASANDGGIAFGGSPGLLKGHPSVSMTSEVIRITVDETVVHVDCHFVFTNHGPATTVRMGFPDQGVGADDPDEETDSDEVMHSPARTTFTSFRSYVEGKPVPATLIRADQPGEYWHAKTVRFPAHSVLHVRDVYTQRVGGGIVAIPNRDCFASQIGYILHTGASWHGNIGRSEVVITFLSSKLPAYLKAVPVTQVSKSRDGRDLRAAMPAADVVVWCGPCRPTVEGRTLRFVRENWHPTATDDIELTYNYTELHDPTDAPQKNHTIKTAGNR